MLTRLHDLANELSELDTVVPESMILPSYLEGLLDGYHWEKRVLAGECLVRTGESDHTYSGSVSVPEREPNNIWRGVGFQGPQVKEVQSSPLVTNQRRNPGSSHVRSCPSRGLSGEDSSCACR